MHNAFCAEIIKKWGKGLFLYIAIIVFNSYSQLVSMDFEKWEANLLYICHCHHNVGEVQWKKKGLYSTLHVHLIF
jgi:hypothetical protein